MPVTSSSRKRDADGTVIGHANVDPRLDTRRYRVTFDDGNVSELTTNQVA